MSDEQDESQKTEEPSEKKLTDARRKGDIPTSREVATAAGIGAAAALMAFAAPPVASRFTSALTLLVANAHDISLNRSLDDFSRYLFDLFAVMIAVLSPIFLAFAAAGVGAAFAQNAVVFSTERIKPQPNRLNPAKGFKRMFSTSSFVELGKSVAKVAAVATVVAMFTLSEVNNISSAASYDLSILSERIQSLTIRLLGVVLVTTIVITVLDVLWQRLDWRKKQRMTKQEVKDEHKQLEGDPHIKARVAEIRRARARKARIQAVPNATVVIANPTHFAVALRYAPEESDAPVCIAKGRNKIALKIREVAEKHNVPVVENPPLARALHDVLQEDHPIPEEYYQAVAEIINYVFRSGARNLTL